MRHILMVSTVLAACGPRMPVPPTPVPAPAPAAALVPAALPPLALDCPAGTTRGDLRVGTATTWKTAINPSCVSGDGGTGRFLATALFFCGTHVLVAKDMRSAACFDAEGHIDGPFSVVAEAYEQSGTCRDDVPQGEWRTTMGGDTEITTYDAGRRHGPYRSIASDDLVLREGAYADGAPDGMWVWRDGDNWVQREERFRGGTTVALRTPFFACDTDDAGAERCVVPAEGQPRLIGTRAPGAATAAWTVWYPTASSAGKPGIPTDVDAKRSTSRTTSTSEGPPGSATAPSSSLAPVPIARPRPCARGS